MKTRILFFTLFLFASLIVSQANAKNEKRKVAAFSEISLRVSGTVHLKQGSTQSVEIEAKSSTLGELITEVKDKKLIIRFPARKFFWNSFNPGKVEIFITVPKIDGLSVSGSGDIIADGKMESRILDLAVSGSGNIAINDLDAERINASVSGSGDINIKNGGLADEFIASISGSGDVNAKNFDAKEVEVKIAGSGNCSIKSNGKLEARIAGSGSVYYNGSPSVDASVAGSGKVRKL